MDRRGFLLSGTVAAAGSRGLATGSASQPALVIENQPPVEARVRLVFAGSAFPTWIQEAIAQLRGRLAVEVLRWVPVDGGNLAVPEGFPAAPIDVDNRQELQRALALREAVVICVPEVGAIPPAARVEEATRRTYQLLQAAVAAGVKGCLLVSTLRMFELYDEDFLVDEDWRPRAVDDEHGLAEYLAEFVCREFAREKLLRVLVLRVGRVMDRVPPPAEARRLGWVLRADAIEALQRAAEAVASDKRERWRWWTCLHIGGRCPPARFPTTRAQKLIGYRPTNG
ncbi:MAG: hypothetical protein NZ899_05305 [Thermoguttaceae bacterium]|nr:hypothetical protein [Thermoguttaceae bacterium]MDW8078266.1 hypothetical protein [Thermoguttaceae bacterium]